MKLIVDIWLGSEKGLSSIILSVHVVYFIGQGYYNDWKFKNKSNLFSYSNELRS